MAQWLHIPTATILEFSEGYQPQPKTAFKLISTTESSQSTSALQDLTCQIEGLIESLGQELAETEDSIQEIATRLEVVEENCSLTRDHISSLRTASSQLRTMSGLPPRKNRQKIGQVGLGAGLGLQQAAQFAEAGGQPAAPVPLPPGLV